MDLDNWWNSIVDYFSGGNNKVLIIGMAGKRNHWTTVKSINKKEMKIMDSGIGYDIWTNIEKIKKSEVVLKGYNKKDKYIIFPFQIFYLSNNK